MDYEKKYKETLERARKWYNDSHITIGLKGNLKDIFPELAEPDDERIRKILIDYFDDANKSDENPLQSYGIHTDEVIAWLEKQGNEPKVSYTTIVETGDGGINALVTRELPTDGCDDEQEPADKVEPKFKEGQWVIYMGTVAKILDLQKHCYVGKDINDKDFVVSYCNEHLMRQWTIQDAKDGDVLYAGGSHCYFKEYIFMFSSFTEDNVMSTHFGYDVFHGTFDKDITRFGREEDFMFVTPATKKRRELLFQKMKENDYELDSEKKELKKIEQKSALGEVDKDFMYDTLSNLTELKDRYGEGYGNVGKCIDWLKSLKDRVQTLAKIEKGIK